MATQPQGDEQKRKSFDAFVNSTDKNFNFDLWAVAVRRQMLASLKRREGNRSGWE